MLVQFIHDFNYTAAAEAHLTNALTIAYKAGMIVEVEPECFLFASAIGAAESLEPPEIDEDDDDDGEAE